MKGSVPATGWDTGLCQDYDRKLALWFATRLGARHTLKGMSMKENSTQAKSLREQMQNLVVEFELDQMTAHCEQGAFTVTVLHPQNTRQQLVESAVEVLEQLGWYFNGVTWVQGPSDSHSDADKPIKPLADEDLFTHWPFPPKT